MATAGESSNEADDKLKDLEREISELRSAKKDVFQRTRSDIEELERIAKREHECVDKRHRVRTQKHDREIHCESKKTRHYTIVNNFAKC